MARRKFPSDRRPWFRCLTDILHDEKLTGDCPADVFRFYIRLLAALQQTGSRDGKITLDRHALCALAGREQVRHALRVARAGAARKLYAACTHGERTVVTVPKWAKLQGFAPTPDVPREEKRREEERESAPATPAPHSQPRAAARKPKGTPCPEQLTDTQRDQVNAWRNRLHPELDARELRAQWARFTDHYIGEGDLRADWVRVFYKWLTGPFYKRLTPTPTRPVVVVEREAPPPDDDPVLVEAAIAESRALRATFRGGGLRAAAGGA